MNLEKIKIIHQKKNKLINLLINNPLGTENFFIVKIFKKNNWQNFSLHMKIP
jgi:hypothetical protein